VTSSVGVVVVVTGAVTWPVVFTSVVCHCCCQVFVKGRSTGLAGPFRTGTVRS